MAPSASRCGPWGPFWFVVYVSLVLSAVLGAPLIILPFYILQEDF